MPKSYSQAPAMTLDVEKTYLATFETSRGTIVAQLFPKNAPITVNNFVTLAKDGFYDGLTFHRVESWVIQGGDPTGSGAGGPGYKFMDEPVVGEYEAGVVAMANAGPNTNGSQFFILKQDMMGRLAKAYNLFGKVIQGQDVVNQIRRGDTMITVKITEADAA